MLRKLLLFAGILAPLLYVGSDIIAATLWPGYAFAHQSVSELRAVGAPTRAWLVPLLFVYSVLEVAFAVGVLQSAAGKRSLRICGALLLTLGLVDLVVAPFAQLNLNRAFEALPNTLHLFVTALTVILIFLTIGFGAGADGTWFRYYSYATLAIFVIAGIAAFLYLPQIAAGQPTLWMGVRERINIYGFMLWMAMLASVLLRGQRYVLPLMQGRGQQSQPLPSA